MGAVEQDIDRYAEELSELDAMDEAVDKQWSEAREALAEQLAAGKTLKAGGRPVLSKDDVVDHLFFEKPDEANTAMVLCFISPAIGGKHIKRLMEEMALDLLDDYADAFKDDIQRDIQQGEAA